MTAQPGLCGTRSETPKTAFSQRGSFNLFALLLVIATQCIVLRLLMAYIKCKQQLKTLSEIRVMNRKLQIAVLWVSLNFSVVVRKPAFCTCKNKDADQLRGNREAAQRLCFRYTASTISLLPKSKISSL